MPRLLWSVVMAVTSVVALANDSICYKMELSGTLSGRTFAPTWLTANRYGMGSAESRSGYLRAGTFWQHDLKKTGKYRPVWNWLAL